MKMKLPLMIATAITILLSSCQREPDQVLNPNTNSDSTGTTPNGNTNRVKTYTETLTSNSIGNYSETFNASYDNNGRLISLISTTSPGNKFVYSFAANNLYTLDLYNGGEVAIHENFYLNDLSLIDSTFQYNNTEDSSTEKYFYNADKQPLKVKEYIYTTAAGSVLDNTTTYTYDASGNLIKTQDTDTNVDTYDYYSNLSYAQPLAPGPITAETTKKKNLVKTHTVTSNGSLVGKAEYTYTFDDKDRISTETQTVSDGSVVTKTYTYF